MAVSFKPRPADMYKDVYDTDEDGVVDSAETADHGALTGLNDDDHSQYLNTTRHDADDHDMNIDGRDVSVDGTKLDGIEVGATADQTGAEIKTAYEGEADTNAFTDAEKTKLAGIEASADVTDATNVDAAGAVMNTDTTTASMSFVVDEDDMASDLATKVPTQQSVKAFAESQPVFYEHHQTFVYRYPTNAGWWSGFAGSAFASYNPHRMVVWTGATIVSNGKIYVPPHGLATTTQYTDFGEDFKFFCWFSVAHTDTTNRESWISILNSSTFNAVDLTTHGIGINVKENGGVGRNLYACSHDGTTYSETDTSQSLQNSTIYKLELIYTAGTSLVVKLNDSTVATKTTNLPTSRTDSRFGIATNRSGGADTSYYDNVMCYFPTIYGWL